MLNERIKEIRALLWQTYIEWVELKPALIGAALAFYIIFSLGPILVITIGIVGAFYGEQTAGSQIVHEINTIAGPKPAEVMQLLIRKTFVPPSSHIATVISFPMVALGAGLFFFQLKRTLNIIWGVSPVERHFLKRLLKNYLLSFLMVVSMGLLLYILVIKSLILALLWEFIRYYIPVSGTIVKSADFIVTFGVITILFGLIYDFLPDVRIKISEVWVGAGVTSLLFTSTQYLTGLYISKTNIETTYGAIGSISVLLIWIFYSSLIFLLGAVFTKVYACRHGRPHIRKE